MITEFEEHDSQGSAKLQFTVSRKSLPNLLEWSDRFQFRFKVTIDIQWELDHQVAPISDNPQVRWVVVTGKAENCKKAKNYITIFCDSQHQMDVTYPDFIDRELKESQAELEEEYSVVLQFFKVGQLLLKSNDEINLSLVVSFIEDQSIKKSIKREFYKAPKSEITSRGQNRRLNKLDELFKPSGSLRLERQIDEESGPSYLPEDDLDVDSFIDDLEMTPTGASQPQRNQTLSPSPKYAGMDLLGGEPLLLRSKGDRIFPGQVWDLISPASSLKGCSISPDRKKIKSQEERNAGSVASFGSESKTHSGASGMVHLFTLSLSSQQKLAIQRILQKGDYTRWEIDRILQKHGKDWQCSDLIMMLHEDRKQRNVAQAPSRYQTTSKLDELRSTQKSLMKSLLETDSPVPVPQGRSASFWPEELSTAKWHTGKLQRTRLARTSEHTEVIEGTPFSDFDGSIKHSPQMAKELDESVMILEDNDSIIIIPSDSESEIVIGDSMKESHTHEVFYNNGAAKEKLPQRNVKQERTQRGSTTTDKQTMELRGVIEGLKQQMKKFKDEMEQEKADVSSQQQVVTLLQQTQQEQMQQQYEQQQERLLEQQRQFQKQFELQEQELKVQQEMALKELQQMQKEAGAAPDHPVEGIIIAPAKKNVDSPLRPVVIDGSNVAMKHGRNEVFSCRGIAICIQYFQKRGHQDITVFVPQGRSTQNPNWIDRPLRDQKILNMLEKQGLLSYTPSRRIGNNYVNCYDDRFIVELAVENDGVIVSNDNYRDLMGESPQWKYVIENRLVMFTFAGDHFMIPDDPLGWKGPRIEQILRKTKIPAIGPNFAGRQRLPYTRPGPAGSLSARPAVPGQIIPATGALQCVTGAVIGAQVARQAGPGPRVARQAGPGPRSARKSAAKPNSLAPTLTQKPGTVQRDVTSHPSYEALMNIFPDNEEEVRKVLSQHVGKTDSNELVILVLVEKEKTGDTA